MVFQVLIPNDYVFERINPKVFECCFQRWVQSIVETVGAQVIPIDGKTVRGSYDREQKKSALHLVSAWASEHRLVLGQVKVADKSNEITAIPALLELLDRVRHSPSFQKDGDNAHSLDASLLLMRWVHKRQ